MKTMKMKYHRFSIVALTWTVASVLMVAPLFAQDPTDTRVRPAKPRRSNRRLRPNERRL